MAKSIAKGYKGRGIVLHTLKYGDTSMVAHLLTDTVGRQSYMVQGVRSSKGRGSKAALLQPFFTLDFEGVIPSHGEMHRFREMQSGILLRRTPFDIRRSTIALFCAEVIYRLVRDGESNSELFDFVWRSVEALDTIESGVANFHLWFLANLSRQLGFMPSGEWQSGSWFDIAEGEYCSSFPSHGLVMQPHEAELLSRLIESDVMGLGDIELGRERRVGMLEALLKYYNYHLDSTYSVQSIDILKEIF